LNFSNLGLPNYTLNFIAPYITTDIFKKHTFFLITLLCFILGATSLNAQDIKVKSGDIVSIPGFPPTSCTYSWSNDKPETGLAAGGTGNMPTFTAVNKSGIPIKATITYSTIPQHEYAYIGSRDDNSLAVVNLTTGKEETRVNINTEVWGILITKDGSKIYTSSENSFFINVFDAVNNVRLPSIAIPYRAWGMALSPNEDQLYVSHTIEGKYSIIDTKLNTLNTTNNYITPNTSSSSANYSLIVSPDGKKLFHSVGVTDLATNIRTADSRFLGSFDYVYSADKSKLYFSLTPSPGATKGTVRIYDFATDFIDEIKLDGGAGNLALSPDGKTLYADNYFSNFVYVIDIQNKVVLKKIDLKAEHRGLAVGLNGTRLYTINVDGGLMSVDTKTYEVNANKSKLGLNTPVLFGKFTNVGTCYSDPITFTITVDPLPPVITAIGSLSKVDAVYGTSGVSTSFTVSGTNLPAGILVTPPASYEASTDGVTYTSTLTVGSPGTVDPTTVYLRLKLTAPVGSYAGNVVLSSGAANITLPTVLSKITPAPLTLNAGITKKYGEVLTSGTSATNFTAVGLKNNETIGSVTLTYGAGSTATAGVNTYTGTAVASAPIGGTFLLSNYLPSYANSDIVVEAVVLTITADDKERVYGEVNPPFTLKYTGFVNNESAAQLTTLPVLSTVAIPTSPVGQYPITISGAVAVNYTFNYVPSTLTVKSTIITINSAFTPNGDGINDTWDIKYIGQFPNCTVEVMNRYGEKVFYAIGYPTAWNGKRGGTNVPSGTYYYIIKLTSSMKPFTGYLSIIR
jgi:gliding motility-associated-like protein